MSTRCSCYHVIKANKNAPPPFPLVKKKTLPENPVNRRKETQIRTTINAEQWKRSVLSLSSSFKPNLPPPRHLLDQRQIGRTWQSRAMDGWLVVNNWNKFLGVGISVCLGKRRNTFIYISVGTFAAFQLERLPYLWSWRRFCIFFFFGLVSSFSLCSFL